MAVLMPPSAVRALYLVAYDIADPRRLAHVHRLLGWKVGGQKSFYECWLTPVEAHGGDSRLAGVDRAG